MKWFTADWHLGHANIIKYCNRPFVDADEMNWSIVERHNEVVAENDETFVLGDVSLSTLEYILMYLSSMNGKLNILTYDFHHDYRWLKDSRSRALGAYRLPDNVELVDPIVILPDSCKWPIVLCHFPFAEWPRKHHGAIHLHGHSHGNHRAHGRILDVGVDNWDFYPVSLMTVMELMDGVEP